MQEACYDVIEGLCWQMGEEIEPGQIGAIATDDTATLGYYLVEFTTEAFLYYNEEEKAENSEAANHDNQQIEEGSLVVRGRYYSLMTGAPHLRRVLCAYAIFMHTCHVIYSQIHDFLLSHFHWIRTTPIVILSYSV